MAETIAAPTPAPAAPSPNATPAAPAADKASTPFSDLDSRASAPRAKKEPEAKVEKQDGDEFEPVAPVKPKEEGVAPAAPAAKTAPIIEAPKVLREKLTSTTRELDQIRQEHTKATAKLAELEKRGMDTTAITEKLTKTEKEFQALQAELSSIRYEKSPEFKTKFEAPFNRAAESAKQIIISLKANEQDEAGNITQRPATWDDFSFIYSLPDAKAEDVATRLFGVSAGTVLRRRDALKELDANRRTAIEEHQATAGEREKASIAEKALHSEKVNRAWNSTNDDLIKANPEWFGEKADDEERSSLWKESLSVVDQAYTGRANLTPDQQITLDAHIRLRAAAYPVMQKEVVSLRAELAELKKSIEEGEASRPGATRRTTGGEGKKTEPVGFEDMGKENIFT